MPRLISMADESRVAGDPDWHTAVRRVLGDAPTRYRARQQQPLALSS